jgi:hypothetical protein
VVANSPAAQVLAVSEIRLLRSADEPARQRLPALHRHAPVRSGVYAALANQVMASAA